MKKTIAIIAAAILLMAFTADNQIHLTLTPDETQYILNVLQERPYKESAGLINKIITQANADTVKKTK